MDAPSIDPGVPGDHQAFSGVDRQELPFGDVGLGPFGVQAFQALRHTGR
jgi:hypothetical protein